MTDYGQLDRHVAEFLELWAPLRKYRKPVADDLGNMACPAIYMPCGVCPIDQTFVSVGYEDKYGKYIQRYQWIEHPWDAFVARYICAACRNYGRLFSSRSAVTASIGLFASLARSQTGRQPSRRT